MKKIVFILAIAFASTALISCGGSNDEDNQQTEENETKQSVYKDSYVSIELDNDWNVNDGGARNETTGYSIFSFGVYSSGDIHEDFLVDHEQIGEITETTVDGMPAVTRLQKYKTNEMRMGRVWLIYDGTDIVSFNVDAPENEFNDDVAQEIIAKVTVLNKGENVKLPKKEGKTYFKPEEFPEDIINNFSEYLSTDVILTEENVKNAIVLMDTLINFDTTGVNALSDEQKNALADSINQEYGFDNMQNMIDITYKPVMASIMFLALFENHDDNNPIADELIIDMLKQNSVSKEDIKFTYDNWEIISELLNKFE